MINTIVSALGTIAVLLLVFTCGTGYGLGLGYILWHKKGKRKKKRKVYFWNK